MREEIAKAEKAERGLSLVQFIKQRGGLKDVEGDLKALALSITKVAMSLMILFWQHGKTDISPIKWKDLILTN